MKKIILSSTLFLSIGISLVAQKKFAEDAAFELPDNIVVYNRYYIELGAKNKLTVELTDITDINRILNVDSILNMYLTDIAAFKDSLTDPLTSKRIDYVIDAKGNKKIRIRQFKSASADFVLSNGELSTLKINQDTISIISVINNPPKAGNHKVSVKNARYYHLLFYLNSINDLPTYMKGTLAEKFATIKKYNGSKWLLLKGGGSHYLVKDKAIVADKPNGFTNSGTGDLIMLHSMVNIQNYKSYFVPSFSVGVKFVFSNRERTYKWEPGLYWEPHFLFGKDATGKLRTYRNDFLMLSYGAGGETDHDPSKGFSFSAVFSLGYLIHRSGDFIDKHTFRLGMGKLQLSKTSIEPSIYFNKLFKGVTPGIRITQNF